MTVSCGQKCQPLRSVWLAPPTGLPAAHLPICAISTASPTWRMKVDLPANQDKVQGRSGLARSAH